MKNNNNYTCFSKNFSAVLVLLFILLIANTAFAQKRNDSAKVMPLKAAAAVLDLNKYALKNLISGIQSDITDIRRNAIYYAGKYKIKQALLPLMAQLREEKNPAVRKLIAHSLYQIGDLRGIYIVKSFARNDENEKVKHLCSAIYNASIINASQMVAEK